MPEIALKHDSSRIIQCMVKYGNNEQRNEIYKELVPHFVECSQSKHGSFLAVSLVHYANKDRLKDIIEQIKGHLYSLALHQISSVLKNYII